MSLPSVAWNQAMQQQPTYNSAYNTVNARVTLMRPAPPQQAAAPPPAAKPQKVEWTPAVRDYVRRAFDQENAIEGISPEDMQNKLKEILQFFAERQSLSEIDWQNHPLPQAILKNERAAAMQAGAATQANAPTNMPHTLNTGTKKRKSQDMTDLPTRSTESPNSIPPWRKANLEDRITYPNGHNDKRQKKHALSADVSSKFDQADLEKRRQRFQLGSPGNKTTPPWNSPRVDSDSDMNVGPVVGTNEQLEKSYFRLTAPPKAETVRPLHVLEKTLSMLLKKWKAEKNYGYICNQFKSLRQDLTVQHIKNAFTVKVYEMHARIALEKGDLGEYNQCQTQLKALYAQKLGGKPNEFLAYRILYFVYTCNRTDMNDLLSELTPADKVQPCIKHALDVRSALALGNYHKFFKLYNNAENMGGYLMDMFVERERLNALANMSRAYPNGFTLRFLTEELGFESDQASREFLESHNAQHIIEERPGETGTQIRIKIKEAAALFDRLRAAAFSKVDIKGQI